MPIREKSGSPTPYGATQTTEGVNFSLYAPYAVAATLHLFDAQRKPLNTFPLKSKTGSIWHIELQNLPDTFLYGWEIKNSRFIPLLRETFDHLLLDPYAKEIDVPTVWKTENYQPLAKFSKEAPFDWGEDTFPNLPTKDLIIYEMHVRAFHKTFNGLKEKLPYLKELGINAIELLPIFEFNEAEYIPLSNFWGYSTVHYFTPMGRYGTPTEFKELVKAAHALGIEIILDVVYNHTAESDVNGPTYSFKGLDPMTFYQLSPYLDWLDFTGCGNTVNCNHPIVREWILASLRHWVQEYHIDGFRFDLASIFYRGEAGKILSDPPLVDAITKDPLLQQTKLIAEPWDATGFYQVGAFSNSRWIEWNGQYRDVVRRFIRGDDGLKGIFATRITGSQDLYFNRTPQNSLNFVTCHDGFTLRDLVSYNHKHNLPNLEENRDGSPVNDSANYGVEGPTDNEEINALRLRQMKNFILTLFISQGIPMLHSGDEYGHTKNGNNNTWCQDNALNYFQWGTKSELFEFTKKMIHLRKMYPHFRKSHFLSERDIHWYGSSSDRPHWNLENHFVAFKLMDESDPLSFYIAFNASNKKITITLPKTDYSWRWLVNTGGNSESCTLEPHSAIILRETTE